jgi:hypothetical protein
MAESPGQAFPQLGAMADECSRLGVPLMAEAFPAGGPGGGRRRDGPQDLAVA